VETRGKGSKIEYLVKWESKSAEHNCWVDYIHPHLLVKLLEQEESDAMNQKSKSTSDFVIEIEYLDTTLVKAEVTKTTPTTTTSSYSILTRSRRKTEIKVEEESPAKRQFPKKESADNDGENQDLELVVDLTDETIKTPLKKSGGSLAFITPEKGLKRKLKIEKKVESSDDESNTNTLISSDYVTPKKRKVHVGKSGISLQKNLPENGAETEIGQRDTDVNIKNAKTEEKSKKSRKSKMRRLLQMTTKLATK